MTSKQAQLIGYRVGHLKQADALTHGGIGAGLGLVGGGLTGILADYLGRDEDEQDKERSWWETLSPGIVPGIAGLIAGGAGGLAHGAESAAHGKTKSELAAGTAPFEEQIGKLTSEKEGLVNQLKRIAAIAKAQQEGRSALSKTRSTGLLDEIKRLSELLGNKQKYSDAFINRELREGLEGLKQYK